MRSYDVFLYNYKYVANCNDTPKLINKQKYRDINL